MLRKFKYVDAFFTLSLFIAFLLLSIYIFTHPNANDETFYSTIPFRFINGDNIVEHEWHLSQFSAFFTYLPVRVWIALKNSTEGIVVFLRCVYFFIHILTTILIYRFFRTQGKWAIVASMIFFTLVAYRIFAISYNSMIVVFLLLFTLSLLSILNKSSFIKLVFTGVCYACCCVCNPLLCVLFVVYIFIFVVRYVRTKKTVYAVRKLKTKDKRHFENIEENEVYKKFFNKNSIAGISLGIIIVVMLAIAFFLLVGGSFSSLMDNLYNMLDSSEYKIMSSSLGEKLKETIQCYNKLSLKLPLLLPALYIALFLDKKRTTLFHRFIFLFLAFVLSLMYSISMFAKLDHRTLFITLPLAIFSTTCYMLTDKKNKTLFYYMWAPGLIVSIFSLVASNTFLTAVGVVFQVNNVAGVFFICDLFKEIKQNEFLMLNKNKSRKKSEVLLKKNKSMSRLSYIIICVCLCFQLIFQMAVLYYDQFADDKKYTATNGPFEGIHMTEKEYNNYNASLNDIDIIKSKCQYDTPVLLMSSQNWMYLYLDQPIATYTAWFEESIDCEQLVAYYKKNNEKIPTYIYVDSAIYNFYDDSAIEHKINVISSLFDFTQEELNNGILLKVQGYKFNLSE